MSNRTRYIVGIVLVLAMVLSVVSLIVGPQDTVGSTPRTAVSGNAVPAVLHLAD